MTPREEFKYSLMNLMWLKNSAPRDLLEGLYDKFVEDFAPKDTPKKDEKIGISRRDYFAAMALSGILVNGGWRAAESAVQYADELIKELEEKDERTM